MYIQLVALKFTVVKPLQPENAELPIVSTELGMVTEVKPLQPEKAEAGMFCTLFPIVKVESDEHPLKTEVMYIQLVALKFTVVKPLQ